MPLLRNLCIGIALALVVSLPGQAQDSSLPELGSSAAELLSPKQQAEYGAYTLHQLRNYGYVLDDPLLNTWLQATGDRLGAASDKPDQSFTFFLLKERQINAFATFGGYIGMNAGLILTAKSEAEMAGVLAHEISHVTQQHILRSVERSQKDQLPILLGMLGVIAAAQQSDSNSADDAIMSAVVGGQALMAQRRINYTRSNESEADRVGIQTLKRAGYDVNGMADFFDRMATASRGNSGGYQTPDYLRTHPVTSTRISEARDRANRVEKNSGFIAQESAQQSPLLPGNFGQGLAAKLSADSQFDWARERLRTLTAKSKTEAVGEYRAFEKGLGQSKLSDYQRYGYALALMRNSSPGAAEPLLEPLLIKYPGNLWVETAYAENAHYAGKHEMARQRFEALLKRYPQHTAISLSYAQVLAENGSKPSAQRAQSLLRPLLAEGSSNPVLQKTFARACELAGDIHRAAEAYAEVAYLNGRPEDALKQLDALLKKENVDYVQRARIEARMAAIKPEVLEMQRQGIRSSDLPPDRN